MYPATETKITVWVLLAAFFMLTLDTTIVNIAIPTLEKDFNASINTVMWVNSAYLLAYAVPILAAGRLGDIYGPEKVFLWGLGLFTLASLACGLSSNITMLIIARVFQGIGAALQAPQVMSIITKMLPAEKRGQALGYWGTIAAVATIVGPLVGGFIIDSWGWQGIFFINVPIGIITLYLGLKYIPALEKTPSSVDYLGILYSALGIFAIVYGIQQSGSVASTSMLLISGVIFLGLFIVHEKNVNNKTPLLPPKLFTSKNWTLANIAIFIVGFAYASFTIPLISYMQSGLHKDAIQTGIALIPMSIATAVCAPYAGRLSDKYSGKQIAMGGIALFMIALGLMAAGFNTQGELWKVVGPSVLAGIGISAVFAPLGAVASKSAPTSVVGASSGAFNTFRQLGGVFGSAAIAVALATNTTGTLDNVTSASRLGMAIPAIFLSLALIACARMTPQREQVT